MAKWIEFRLTEQLPKTKVFEVVNKESGFVLGQIRWYAPWRRYAFVRDIVLEQDCLRDIAEFLDTLMKERKK